MPTVGKKSLIINVVVYKQFKSIINAIIWENYEFDLPYKCWIIRKIQQFQTRVAFSKAYKKISPIS